MIYKRKGFKMEELIALSKIISKQKVKQIDVLFDENDLSPITKKFYSGLANSAIKTDSEAVEYLYGTDLVSSKYRKLKARLRDKLINTLFFIDIQQFSRNDFDAFQVKSYFLLSAYRILRSRGYSKAAISLAERAFKLSIKFDLIDIAYFLSNELKYHYSVFEISKSKIKLYTDAENDLFEKFILERKAKNCFSYFGGLIQRNADLIEDKVPPEIIEQLSEIESNINKMDMFEFNFFSRNALYFKAYLQNNIEKMAQVSESAVAYYERKKGFSKVGEFSFLQKLGLVYQMQKKYHGAIEVYQKAFKLNPGAGTLSWYNIRFHLFNAHLHLKEYQQAYSYLLEATSHKSFRTLNVLNKEPWILKEAYMHLLIKIGKVTEDKSKKQRLRPFRLSRFLNEVEHFSKDKRGLNIAVNIIHALFLFLQKKDDEFERRLDALGQYSFRYLRRDETLRSNAFIKMLQKLPDAGFHPLRVKRHTEKYYKRMVEAPIVIQENSKEVEIIPYEHLWEIVIELLELRLDKKV